MFNLLTPVVSKVTWSLDKLVGIYMGDLILALYFSTWFMLLLAVFSGGKEVLIVMFMISCTVKLTDLSVVLVCSIW